MFKKLSFLLAFTYIGVLNSAVDEAECDIHKEIRMLYRAPEINLGATIGHLFLDFTVTQEHFYSDFAVVNPDQIGAFFSGRPLSNSTLEAFRSLTLQPLYYEYVHVGTTWDKDIFTDDGWQVQYCYVAMLDNTPLTIKISPKCEYLETARMSKSVVNRQRDILKGAFRQLKQSVSAIPSGAQKENAKTFLHDIKALTDEALAQLKEMSAGWSS